MVLHPAFDLTSIRPLHEQGGEAFHLRHRRTGAEVVAVSTNDTNKLFAITFATLPDDDTGVAHILEHLVFRGSRAFPMTRPFAGLLQGSLQTYLNATTGPDRTSFHVASRSDADLGNLIDVMLDAVLRPLLRTADFEEEAWHLALDGPRAEPRLGGIVLAEMRGHLAVPGNLLLEEARAALLPDTVYARTYGGAPDAIPRLTHADLVAFHRRHYHPSGARIFLWGAQDFGARLGQIDRHLRAFRYREPCPPMPAPEGFDAPRFIRRSTPCLAPDSPGLMAMGWVLPLEAGPLGRLGHDLLLMLLSLPDGLMAKVLDAAGRGRLLTGTPRLEAFRQRVLLLGLEGIEPARAGQIGDAILAHLDLISRHGIDAHHLQHALDRLELQLRENVSGPRPRGLVVLDRIVGAWRHGRDPLERLDHVPALTELRAGLSEDQAAMPAFIRRALVQNTHRATLSLEPGPSAAEGDRVAVPGRPLSLNARRRLVRRTALRRTMTPAAQAVRGSLPVLSRSELPRQVTAVPTEVCGPVLLMNLGESGILRADLSMDLGNVPPAWLGYVPVLGRLLVQGHRGAPSATLETGVWSRAGPRRSAAGLLVRGRCLVARRGDLLSRMMEVLQANIPPEPHRLVAAISEEIARQEARLLSAGHQMVDLRLRAGSGTAGAVADNLEGLGQLAFLRHLRTQVEVAMDRVLHDLQALWTRLVHASNLTVGLSGTEDPAFGSSLIAAASDRGEQETVHRRHAPAYRREAHVIPLPVQAVGQAADLRMAGFSNMGAAGVGLCAISTGWLWDAVRVAGGAYGATATIDGQTGVAALLSFRDPHLLRTLDVFAESGAWLRRMAGPDLLDRAVIGAIAALDRLRPPDALALDVLQRHITGLTDDVRQAELEAVLAATPRDLNDLADALDASLPVGPVAVLGSRSALRAALEERPNAFDLVQDPDVSDATPSRTAAVTSG